MKILFDQNVPKPLRRFLVGHEVVRAAERGWQELQNGDLLHTAENNSFDVLISSDQNLAYQQKVTQRKIAIIVLSTNNWSVMKDYVSKIADAVETARPGMYEAIDCGRFIPRHYRK